MHEENFVIKNIDCHSVQIELTPHFFNNNNFPAARIIWVQLGTKPIGLPPQPDGVRTQCGDTLKNGIDDEAIIWQRYSGDKLTPEKRRIRLKNLQPNFCYFVRLDGDNFSDDIKSFWTTDWPDNEKTQATVENNVDFSQFYTLGRRLGRGHFGDVNLCVEKTATTSPDQQTPRIFAVKVMKASRRQQIEANENEIAIMRDLRHVNVVWLKHALWAPRSTVYLVMEFVAGGELFDKISSDNYVLTELDCALYVLQICQALSYIHAKNIVHLDLKVENIMLACPERRQIKIVDFGIARKLTPGVPCKVMCGTAEFCAPEVLKFDPISTLTDIWSVGVITYIMLSGLSPFLGDNDAETHANVVAGEYSFDDPAFDLISDPAKEFISKLMVKNKEQRLSAEMALAHEWLVAANKAYETLKVIPTSTSTSSSLDDLASLNGDELDPAITFGRRISVTAINTTKLRQYWARRKWKKACGVLRAVQRISCNWAQRSQASLDRSISLPSTAEDSASSSSSCPSSKDTSPAKLQDDETNNNKKAS